MFPQPLSLMAGDRSGWPSDPERVAGPQCWTREGASETRQKMSAAAARRSRHRSTAIRCSQAHSLKLASYIRAGLHGFPSTPDFADAETSLRSVITREMLLRLRPGGGREADEEVCGGELAEEEAASLRMSGEKEEADVDKEREMKVRGGAMKVFQESGEDDNKAAAMEEEEDEVKVGSRLPEDEGEEEEEEEEEEEVRGGKVEDEAKESPLKREEEEEEDVEEQRDMIEGSGGSEICPESDEDADEAATMAEEEDEVEVWRRRLDDEGEEEEELAAGFLHTWLTVSDSIQLQQVSCQQAELVLDMIKTVLGRAS